MEPERVEATVMAVPPNFCGQSIKLISRLETGSIGDSITYRELSGICGRDVSQGPGSGNLNTAKKYCLRHKGLLWQTVRGEKRIQCLDEAGKLVAAESKGRGAHRMHGRILTIAAAVNPKELPPDGRLRHYALTSIAAMCRLCSGGKAIKKLEAQNGARMEPNLDRLLESMKT